MSSFEGCEGIVLSLPFVIQEPRLRNPQNWNMEEKGEEEVSSVWKILWLSCFLTPQFFNFLTPQKRPAQ